MNKFGITELTADTYDGFLRNILPIGVKCVQNNEDQKVEHIDRGTLHNDTNEEYKSIRGRYHPTRHSVLLPDVVCNQSCGHSILNESECAYRVHPEHEGRWEDRA